MAERSQQPSPRFGSVDRDLLELLFAAPECAPAILRRYRAAPAADALVDTAIAWGVAPALDRRLQIGPETLPRQAAQRLGLAARSAAVRMLQLTARGAAALASLLAAGIPAAGFKGLALVGRSRHLPLRSMGDVDVLVAEECLTEAIRALAATGFSLDLPGPLADYVAFIRNAPHFSGNRAVSLVDAGGHSLDLHWGFGPMCGATLNPTAVLARSVAGSVFGQSIRRVSRTDGLLLGAHHAMRENFTPLATVKNLLDIDELAGNDGGETIDTAILRGAGTPTIALEACFTIIDRCAGSPRRDKLRETLEPLLNSAHHAQGLDLAAVFDSQVDAPPLNRDVLHLMHAASLREVLHTALIHPRRNRRFMAAIGGVPDRERLWRLLADLRRVRFADLRRYRSLARAKRSSAEV